VTRTSVLARAGRLGAAPVQLRVALSNAAHAHFVGSKIASVELVDVSCERGYAAFSVIVSATPLGRAISSFEPGWISDFSVEGRARTTIRLEIPPMLRVELPRSFVITIAPMRGNRNRRGATATFRAAHLVTAGPVASWDRYRSGVPTFVRGLYDAHLQALGFERDGTRSVTRWRRWAPDDYMERFTFNEDLDTPRPVAPLVLPLQVTVELIGERGGDLGHWSLAALCNGATALALGEGVTPAVMRETTLRCMLVASETLYQQGMARTRARAR